MTRRTITTISIVSCALLIAVACLIFLPKLIDTSEYRHGIALWLSERLGRTVTVGDLTFSVITGPKVILRDLKIADDPDVSNEPFVTAREVDVSVRLMPLLLGVIVVDEIVVKDPVVSIIEKDGALMNLVTLSFTNIYFLQRLESNILLRHKLQQNKMSSANTLNNWRFSMRRTII